MWKQVGSFEKELQNCDKNRNQRQPSLPIQHEASFRTFLRGLGSEWGRTFGVTFNCFSCIGVVI